MSQFGGSLEDDRNSWVTPKVGIFALEAAWSKILTFSNL